MRLVLFILVVLSLTACAVKDVQVTHSQEFNRMAQRISPLLRQKNIIDTAGAYTTPLFGYSLPSNLGQELYTRLSPAFRFEVDPNLLPPTFKDSVTSSEQVEIQQYGFTLSQGSDHILVQHVAATDWNDNSNLAWLILCRVNSTYNNTIMDYYLLVEDTEAKILKPKLLAVYDCREANCQLLIGKIPISESPVIEREAGQVQITRPPSSEPQPEPSKIREQKISG